ncbi:MAG: Flp family type IVb pilin [Rhizobiales bacterium]|nr:Flp family type IVb pilin [Hyphomicrobiales bacterium]
MSALLRRFANADDGATAIEYALIASGIGLAIIVAVQAIGLALNDQYVSFGGLF